MKNSAVVLIAVVACGGRTAPPPPAPPVDGIAAPTPSEIAKEAAVGVQDRALADLLVRHWEWMHRWSPTFATAVGDHRYDDKLDDLSLEAIQASRREARALLEEARALAAKGLAAGDRLTLDLLIHQLDTGLGAQEACLDEEWRVAARGGGNPLARYNDLPRNLPPRTPRDARNLLARVRGIPREVDNDIANLRRGLAAGRVASAESVRRTLAMIDRELAKPDDRWGIVEAAEEGDAAFHAQLLALVGKEVRPAVQRWRDFAANELLPRARDARHEGLSALGGGGDCYPALIRLHTTREITADDLHRLGLSEIARIDKEIQALGARLFRTRNLSATLARLRKDRSLYFATEEEVEANAKEALEAARARIPDFFGTLPRTDCVVKRIPAYAAPYTTTAYYVGPHADGSKPGEYWVNTFQPSTRPRYEAEVLAFHEAIPGHHLQIAIAQELPAVPAFRKYLDAVAFIEGWALYSERLADEMGLYHRDLDRMGMLSFDAWRAARLVVDTGLHAGNWTRKEAVEFMLAHTALSESNIVNEVDRYVTTPGQALAYKVGQLEIRRLRARAEAALGKRFDVKAFHDAVLTGGPTTLAELEKQVTAWIARMR